MGYNASAYVGNSAPGQGGNFSATIPVAGVVGDVYVALASWDLAYGDYVTSVSSSNISWSLAEQSNHTTNNQGFETWIGRVHTAFSANTESVTVAITKTDTSYRELHIFGWQPESGYEFPASGFFVDAASVVYLDSGWPTAADGYSCTPALGGVNAKYLLIGLLAMESTNVSATWVSAGTGYTERREGLMFGSNACVYNVADRIYDGSTNQAVTATIGTAPDYGTSLFGFAVKLSPLGGTPPHARGYGPDRNGVFTGLRM